VTLTQSTCKDHFFYCTEAAVGRFPECQTTFGYMAASFISTGRMPFLVPTPDNADHLLFVLTIVPGFYIHHVEVVDSFPKWFKKMNCLRNESLFHSQQWSEEEEFEAIPVRNIQIPVGKADSRVPPVSNTADSTPARPTEKHEFLSDADTEWLRRNIMIQYWAEGVNLNPLPKSSTVNADWFVVVVVWWNLSSLFTYEISYQSNV